MQITDSELEGEEVIEISDLLIAWQVTLMWIVLVD